jgi:hypothetical protein
MAQGDPGGEHQARVTLRYSIKSRSANGELLGRASIEINCPLSAVATPRRSSARVPERRELRPTVLWYTFVSDLGPEGRVMRYDAFLSYSHAADGKLAPALQRALHRFARPWNRMRALRVFRDTTSLAATPELWPAIVAALGQSSHFLLLASPQAAASKWVQREVEWWFANRPADKLFVLLTAGTIAWDENTRDFDWKLTTALPDLVRGKFQSEPPVC